MADNRDNLDDFDRETETEPILYQEETQAYEPDPPVQTYSADDIAIPPPRRNWTSILLIALIVIKYEQKSVVSTKVLSFLRKF